MTKQDLTKILQDREFNPTQEPPREEIIFRIDFQIIGSLGDFGLITGRPKAGKTKFLAGAMAAGISRKEIFGMTIKLPEGKRRVAHFDTEQGKRSHFNLLTLTRQLIQEESLPDNFKSYHCRRDSAANILALVEHYLELYPDTGIVYLDGLIDCIDNMNDTAHSKHLTNWIKRITEERNVFVLGVLHRSLSTDKSIGHIGSSLDRAAQSVLKVDKSKETKQYVLTSEYLRDADEIQPIAIYFNKQMEMWERTEYINENQVTVKNIERTRKRRPSEYEISEHTDNVRVIFNSGSLQAYSTIVQNTAEAYCVGTSMAKEFVRYLQSTGMIFKTETGYTNIRQAKIITA